MTCKTLWIFIKKCNVKPYSVLVIDTCLVSDDSSRFRRNLLERIFKLIITNDDKIIDEKIQYYINREKENQNNMWRSEEIL